MRTVRHIFLRSDFFKLSPIPPAAPCSIVAPRSQPAGEIAGAFPVSRPAISKHLRLLRARTLCASTAKAAIASISSIRSAPRRRLLARSVPHLLEDEPD